MDGLNDASPQPSCSRLPGAPRKCVQQCTRCSPPERIASTWAAPLGIDSAPSSDPAHEGVYGGIKK
jgi:hypothetical protein